MSASASDESTRPTVPAPAPDSPTVRPPPTPEQTKTDPVPPSEEAPLDRPPAPRLRPRRRAAISEEIEAPPTRHDPRREPE